MNKVTKIQGVNDLQTVEGTNNIISDLIRELLKIHERKETIVSISVMVETADIVEDVINDNKSENGYKVIQMLPS